MKILYLDTSSSFLYCGLVDDDKIIFEIKKNYGRDLSKYTLYDIEYQFKINSVSPKSVDKIILVNGPGSFTGVRIAITIAKTYAWTLNIPIIKISSLEAMAISSSSNTDFIVPILDARRGYVYSAIYDKNMNCKLENQHISLDLLRSNLEEYSGNYCFISNDKFDFECENYSPDILKIVKKYKDFPTTLSHLVNANYLKLTEAEEKNNDRNN